MSCLKMKLRERWITGLDAQKYCQLSQLAYHTAWPLCYLAQLYGRTTQEKCQGGHSGHQHDTVIQENVFTSQTTLKCKCGLMNKEDMFTSQNT